MTRLKPQCRDFANPRHLMDTLNQAMPPSKRCELGKRTGYDYGAHKIFFQPFGLSPQGEALLPCPDSEGMHRQSQPH